MAQNSRGDAAADELTRLAQMLVVLDSEFCTELEDCKIKTQVIRYQEKYLKKISKKNQKQLAVLEGFAVKEENRLALSLDQLKASQAVIDGERVKTEGEERVCEAELGGEVRRLMEKADFLKKETAKLRAEAQLRETNGTFNRHLREVKLLSNFTGVRFQDGTEDHEVKGYILEPNSARTEVFDFDKRQNSTYYITNQLWKKMKVSPQWDQFSLKSVGPKLVPFFKTLAIYFVLFGHVEQPPSTLFHAVTKCLPIVSLIIFVFLHGMSFSEYYSYSRKVLVGLVLSCFGDAFLVWESGYFLHGLVMFAFAQISYASAFGLKPIKPWLGAMASAVGAMVYYTLYPGLEGPMVFFTGVYVALITFMAWRAAARVQIFNDLWTWTKLCACAGALCFLISDSLIAVDKFVCPVPYAHNVIMITYYAAQLGITLSVVDSQVDAFFDDTTNSRATG